MTKQSAACRAVLYLRLSRDDDNRGESESIQNQRALLREYAARKGFSVIDEYADDGWSGTSFDRPRFQDMLRDMEQHRFDIVLVKDLSRLGRDYIQTGRYLELVFPEHGVRLIAVNDGIDTTRADTDLAPFRNVVNEMYARDASRKIRSALHATMQAGKFVGNFAPYGYQKDPKDKNHLIPDERAAAVVRQIFTWAAAGKRPAEIARALNERGEPPPAVYRCQIHPGLDPADYSRHREWTSVGVSRILQDVVYLGHIAQGKTDKISFKSKKTQESSRTNGLLCKTSTSRSYRSRPSMRCSGSARPAAVTGRGHLKISFPDWPFARTAARPCPRWEHGKKVQWQISPAAHINCAAHPPAPTILFRMRPCTNVCSKRCAAMSACPKMNATPYLNV